MTDGLEARAATDCYQDYCENAPFASVGGLDKRAAMVAPRWIESKDAKAYLDGYRAAAARLYGPDWETCEFSWRPALVIGADGSVSAP